MFCAGKVEETLVLWVERFEEKKGGERIFLFPLRDRVPVTIVTVKKRKKKKTTTTVVVVMRVISTWVFSFSSPSDGHRWTFPSFSWSCWLINLCAVTWDEAKPIPVQQREGFTRLPNFIKTIILDYWAVIVSVWTVSYNFTTNKSLDLFGSTCQNDEEAHLRFISLDFKATLISSIRVILKYQNNSPFKVTIK